MAQSRITGKSHGETAQAVLKLLLDDATFRLAMEVAGAQQGASPVFSELTARMQARERERLYARRSQDLQTDEDEARGYELPG